MSSSPSPAPDLAIAPSLAARAVGGFGASILGGAALGAAAWFADELVWPYSLLIPANAIGAWLGVAFVLGASARTLPTGALRGVIGLLSAVAAYYVLIGLFGEGFRAIGASHAATIWGAVALAGGSAAWAAPAAAWRHGAGLAAGDRGRGPRARRSSPKASCSGPDALAAFDQIAIDPGSASCCSPPRSLLGLLLPWFLLRRDERVRGYARDRGPRGRRGAWPIGPVTDVRSAASPTGSEERRRA